jgi:predicted negative regulator of RcsB-dependent stress response
MNSNTLYLIIGVLAVVTVVLGYHFYQERQQTTGIEITTSHNGISIEKTH